MQFNKAITNFFSKEELKEIVSKAMVFDDFEIVIPPILITGYDDGVKIANYEKNYEFKSKEEFLEFLKTLKKTECETIYLDI